jgi:hypothetical protein
MNERIKELILQAGFDHSQYTAEKLVHLVVKECATVCEEIAGMAEATNTGEMARKTRATAISCSNFIKNRFGVKS